MSRFLTFFMANRIGISCSVRQEDSCSVSLTIGTSSQAHDKAVGLCGDHAQGRDLLIIWVTGRYFLLCHPCRCGSPALYLEAGLGHRTLQRGGGPKSPGPSPCKGTVQPSPWGLASLLGFCAAHQPLFQVDMPPSLPSLVWGDFSSSVSQRISSLPSQSGIPDIH